MRFPFDDDLFDKALSINSIPFWPDAKEGLGEIFRSLKSRGNFVLGFTHHSGQSQEGVEKKLHESEFAGIRLEKVTGIFISLPQNGESLIKSIKFPCHIP